MTSYKKKLVELPKQGKAMIVTDIHGNLNDFNRYMAIWQNYTEEDIHFVLTGDFIHAMGLENDMSIEVLEKVKYHHENCEYFHALLGNHEWATISGLSVYKAGINQTLEFEHLLMDRFNNEWKVKLSEFDDFFKKLPVAVKTDNKVFISHAGPPVGIKSIDDIINIADDGYLNNDRLYQILWNRETDYTINDLKGFLRAVGCNAMIVGHTPVNGIEFVDDLQMIVSSSYSAGRKNYLVLELKSKIRDARDMLNMVHELR